MVQGQTIDKVIDLLRDECPRAIINYTWDTDKWYMRVYKVGGDDNSFGFCNVITPEILPRINETAIKRMGEIINGFLGRAR